MGPKPTSFLTLEAKLQSILPLLDEGPKGLGPILPLVFGRDNVSLSREFDSEEDGSSCRLTFDSRPSVLFLDVSSLSPWSACLSSGDPPFSCLWDQAPLVTLPL